MKLDIRLSAPEGSRYGSGAFDAQIGKTVGDSLRLAGMPATVTDVVVADDGSSAVITLDVPTLDGGYYFIKGDDVLVGRFSDLQAEEE